MQTRAALSKHAQSWLDAADSLPPGNGAEAELWGAAGGGGSSEASVDLSVMSPAELAAYEDKKAKLKKAMGERAGAEAASGGAGANGGEGGEDSLEERRRKMMLAMEVGAVSNRGWGPGTGA